MNEALATDRGALMLFDGVEETPVAAVTAGGLSLARAIAQRAGRFILVWQRGATRIEMPLRGRVTADGLSFESEGNPLPVSLAVDRPDLALVQSAFAAEPEVLPKPRLGRLVLRLILALVCIGLAAYDLVRLYHAAVTITPRVAFVSTEVSTITAPTSGTLAFIAGAGPISAGEPVIGIENARGKTVLVDAQEDARVVTTQHRIGERIRRGDALLAVAAPNPPVYVSAIVTREQAFALSRAVTAHYALLDGGAPARIELTLAPGDVLLNTVSTANAGEAPLYQARFRIDADDLLARGAPVYLEFERSLSDAVAAQLASAGISGETSAMLLRPLNWVEALLLPLGGVR
jgi:hypothetical protein